MAETQGDAPGKRVFVSGRGSVTTPSEGGGASTFLDLTDTPSSFTANKYYRVNSGGTAIEEVDLSPVDILTEKNIVTVEMADWEFVLAGAGGFTNLVGTGAVTHTATQPMNLSTGTTNPSSAQVYFRPPTSSHNSGLLNQLNWDTDFEIILIWSDDRAGSAGNRYTNWKCTVGATLGVLAAKGVGIRINRNSASFDFSTHNNASIYTTSVTKPSTTSFWRLHVKHFGAAADPRTELWLDGALVATHLTSDHSPGRIPTATSSMNHIFEVQSTGVDVDAIFSKYMIVQDW